MNEKTKKKVLIIEPHSDDGVIAIGGFLEKYREEYDYYFCLLTASDLNMHHVGKVWMNISLTLIIMMENGLGERRRIHFH